MRSETEENRTTQAESQREGKIKKANTDLDSDQEYDELSRRKWEKSQKSPGIPVQASDSDKGEQSEFEDQGSQSQDLFTENPSTTAGEDEKEEVIVLTESSGTDALTKSCPSEDSITSQ